MYEDQPHLSSSVARASNALAHSSLGRYLNFPRAQATWVWKGCGRGVKGGHWIPQGPGHLGVWERGEWLSKLDLMHMLLFNKLAFKLIQWG